MIPVATQNELRNNINTGVEYEIALYYCLSTQQDKNTITSCISGRKDYAKILSIIGYTNTNIITQQLTKRGLAIDSVSFETQNDEVGPADVVMNVKDAKGKSSQIGLSVKYANTCTLNVTARRFLTDAQIKALNAKLPAYTDKYIAAMKKEYGEAKNWFRKRLPSSVTDEYIDLIRVEAIKNWPSIDNKAVLFDGLYHKDSPIEYWVYEYTSKSCSVITNPPGVPASRANDVVIEKLSVAFLGFYLDGKLVGKMQVKFNNGFIEKNVKKSGPDRTIDGIKIDFGKPFNSWNFSIV